MLLDKNYGLLFERRGNRFDLFWIRKILKVAGLVSKIYRSFSDIRPLVFLEIWGFDFILNFIILVFNNLFLGHLKLIQQISISQLLSKNNQNPYLKWVG